MEELRALAPKLDGIIIEDYGKGLVTQELADAVCGLARETNTLVTVDPNPKNPIAWAGVATVKPNRVEAYQEAGVEDPHDGRPPLEDDTLLEVGRRLLAKHQAGAKAATADRQRASAASTRRHR